MQVSREMQSALVRMRYSKQGKLYQQALLVVMIEFCSVIDEYSKLSQLQRVSLKTLSR